MAGVLSGLLFLLILVIGFYWDVAWHIDNGRDVDLFTPSHTMILVGLGGLVYAAFLTMGFATFDKARVGFKYGVANVPWSSVLLLAARLRRDGRLPPRQPVAPGLRHRRHPVEPHPPPTGRRRGAGDVGPVPHVAEAMPSARPTAVGRGIFVLTGGTVLVALSAVQAEFDFGVPQFQALYLPLLIVVAAGMALVLARLALGPWGAVKVVLVYLGLRGFLALVVGGSPEPHRAPVPPVPGVGAGRRGGGGVGGDAVAAAVRGGGGGAGGDGRSVRRAGVGELSGWARVAMPASMALKVALLGPVAAVAAAVLGAGLGRAFARRDDGRGGGAGRPDAAGRAGRGGRGAGGGAGLPAASQRRVGGRGDPHLARRATGPSWRSSSTRRTRPGGDRVRGDVVAGRGPGHRLLRRDRARPLPVRPGGAGDGELEVGGEPAAGGPGDGGARLPARRPVHRGRGRAVGARAPDLVRPQHRPAAAGAAPRPAWPAVAAWTGLVVMMAVWVGLMAVTAAGSAAGAGAAVDRPGGAGGTTDWSTAPHERSLAPHAR